MSYEDLGTVGEPKAAGDLYVIRCREHQRGDRALFWEARGCGYTYDIQRAGLYTRSEAEAIASNREADIAVPLTTVFKYRKQVILAEDLSVHFQVRPNFYDPPDEEVIAIQDVPEDILSTGREIIEQDDSGTMVPLFYAQTRDRIYRVDPTYADGVAWIDEDGDEVPAGEGLCVGYVDTWETVNVFLTRKACEEYIRATGHQMIAPRLWVGSGYLNYEVERIRNFLAGLADPYP